VLAAVVAGCGDVRDSRPGPVLLTLSASAVGGEGELLRSQLESFMRENPDVSVEIQPTPDAADERHQLYVQWLNARVGEPDVLQLDVIWTPEFAAAGWILPLDSLVSDSAAFFPAALEADRWNGRLFALPWFVDVGMLYWRTDLLERAPASLEELAGAAMRARTDAQAGQGFVWQGARYEGLVTVFLEVLGGFGGEILDRNGEVALAREPAVRALRYLTSALREGWSPSAVLTWQEEQTRFSFQNGNAALMRNWPYAHALLADGAESTVAGRFGVAPMPAAASGVGQPTAALGGAQLAVNAHSRHPAVALRLVRFLTEPEQMVQRARVLGQFPSRPDLYDDPRLRTALAIDPAQARTIIERARPRPVTPVYSELSGILQIWLHRALSGQEEPERALARAAEEMTRLLERVELLPGGAAPREGAR
jgi:multiple sugar transport system substrate-binding protein